MDKLMTIGEVAEYLRIGRITLYRMAQQGKIPASKTAHQWRFKKCKVIKSILAHSRFSIFCPKTYFCYNYLARRELRWLL